MTQNIDDFHCQLIKQSKVLSTAEDKFFKGVLPVNNGAFSPHVYEIHGNVLYMHCSDEDSEHATTFVKSPTLAEVKDTTNHVPKCTECGKIMKPHCMFFDETYSERYYRKETIDAYLEDADLCIVVGTAL